AERRRKATCRNRLPIAAIRFGETTERAKGIEPSYEAWKAEKPPAMGRGLFTLRNQACSELVAQAGAHGVDVQIGELIGRRARRGDAPVRRCAHCRQGLTVEAVVEILGTNRPVAGERGFVAAAGDPAGFGGVACCRVRATGGARETSLERVACVGL